MRRSRSRSSRAAVERKRREATRGLTFHELWIRVGGDRGLLADVLHDEVGEAPKEHELSPRNREADEAERASVRGTATSGNVPSLATSQRAWELRRVGLELLDRPGVAVGIVEEREA